MLLKVLIPRPFTLLRCCIVVTQESEFDRLAISASVMQIVISRATGADQESGLLEDGTLVVVYWPSASLEERRSAMSELLLQIRFQCPLLTVSYRLLCMAGLCVSLVDSVLIPPSMVCHAMLGLSGYLSSNSPRTT